VTEVLDVEAVDVSCVSVGYLRDHAGEVFDNLVGPRELAVVVDGRSRGIVGVCVPLDFLPAPVLEQVERICAGEGFRTSRRVPLSALDGMSVGELAELTGRTPGAIKAARHRAARNGNGNGSGAAH
jgi:hypothetical protein